MTENENTPAGQDGSAPKITDLASASIGSDNTVTRSKKQALRTTDAIAGQFVVAELAGIGRGQEAR